MALLVLPPGLRSLGVGLAPRLYARPARRTLSSPVVKRAEESLKKRVKLEPEDEVGPAYPNMAIKPEPGIEIKPEPGIRRFRLVVTLL